MFNIVTQMGTVQSSADAYIALVKAADVEAESFKTALADSAEFTSDLGASLDSVSNCAIVEASFDLVMSPICGKLASSLFTQ